jgi:hypothetical protein
MVEFFLYKLLKLSKLDEIVASADRSIKIQDGSGLRADGLEKENGKCLIS